jgi:hypothetical protein
VLYTEKDPGSLSFARDDSKKSGPASQAARIDARARARLFSAAPSVKIHRPSRAKMVHLSRSSIIDAPFSRNHGCSTISEWLQFEGVSGLFSIVVGTGLWRGLEV